MTRTRAPRAEQIRSFLRRRSDARADARARWLVVGLGNPGPDYARTRHNAGFLVLDALAARLGGRFTGHRGRADVSTGSIDGVRVVLAKPKTFMNVSGGPVASLRDYYKISTEHLVVVHDELDLPLGGLRLKRGGGDGGHNGLRSVTAALGGPDYLRVRVGIGRPPGRTDAARFVLKAFDRAELADVEHSIERATDAVEALVVEGLERAQNEFHA